MKNLTKLNSPHKDIMRNKKIIISIILLLIIAFNVNIVSADVTAEGSVVYLQTNPSGDTYASGDIVEIDVPTNGDVMALAGSVLVNEQIYEDLAVISGELKVNADIGDDVRAIAGSTTINSTIFGDFVATSGEVIITKNANIGGDVIVSSGTVVVEGTISGNLLVSSGDLQINGVVLGDVDAGSSIITLGPEAKILGDLMVTRESSINEEQVKGEIVEDIKEEERSEYKFPWLSLLVLLIFLIVAGQAMNWISTKYSERTMMNLTQKSISTFFFGLFIIIVFPIIIGILFVSLLGIPLAILLLLFYCVILMLSIVVGAITTGKVTLNIINKKYRTQRGLLLGSLVFVIITIIPILGPIYFLYFLIAGSGAVLRAVISRKSQRKVPVTQVIKSRNSPKRKAPKPPKKKTVKKKTAKRKAPKKKVKGRDRVLRV